MSLFNNYDVNQWAHLVCADDFGSAPESPLPCDVSGSSQVTNPAGLGLNPPSASNEERAKRNRAQDWTTEQTQAFLEVKFEAVQVVKSGKDWGWISNVLREKHKIDRKAKGCENRWTTLKRYFDAIPKHEVMDADARSARSWPSSFSQKFYEMMEAIVAEKNIKRPHWTGPGATRTRLLAPESIKQQVECQVNAALEMLPSSAAGDKILTSMAPLLKQQVEAAVKSAIHLYTLTGNFLVDEHLTRKCTEEQLNIALQPVAEALQTLAQQDQEDQEDLAQLADLDKQQQALDLQKEEIMSKRLRRFG